MLRERLFLWLRPFSEGARHQPKKITSADVSPQARVLMEDAMIL